MYRLPPGSMRREAPMQWILRRAVVSIALIVCLAASASARGLVEFPSPYSAGTIVISQGGRKLFLIVDAQRAIEYPVAVAKHGKEWSGYARVNGKYVEPAWSPPEMVRHDHPELPDVIPGGSPHNPMGARAITLDRDEVAIHGTTRAMRASVGTAASYGCIRMLNEDVIDLFDRVSVGAPVVMTH
jgi:lipoprotein-anchoring transpeptidase ErfK/SrfK